MTHTDDCATERNITTKVNIAGNRQVIKFQNLRDLLVPLLELSDLLEVIAKLDDRARTEQPVLAHHKLSMLERVNVALDKEQIRAGLDRQEA